MSTKNQKPQNLLPFEDKHRKIITLKEAETSEKYGCNPNDRPIEDHLSLGIVNIDKPKGPTSHQVSHYVQKILHIGKSGHSGTLDPKVTGVLPVAVDKATRIVQALLIAGKEYICLMHIHKELPNEEVRKVMDEFIGKINQLPPIKSAVKRQWRKRKVYYIELLDVAGQDVLFKIGCQAGTYIRKICHDMGVKLGCGAHMAQLRRSKAGPFSESTLVTLYDLKDAYHYYITEHNEKYIRHVVQPVENAVTHLPKIWVLDTTVNSICHGASLAIPGIAKLHEGIEPDQLVAIMSLKEELVALGQAKIATSEIMKSEKGMAVKINKVFMKPGLYPRIQNI